MPPMTDPSGPTFEAQAHRQSAAVAASDMAADDQTFVDALGSDEEHEFYGRPENQVPQGPPRRREQATDLVLPRSSPNEPEQVSAAAESGDRACDP
ncbi:MAG: DUF3018 family protein [Acidimicrobiia bacterium]|nr:DUF3018 family protein [Acidimicrobiia bacterium]MYI55517.1 DUF3018 family protein [Acidimicrobiia bacterium]